MQKKLMVWYRKVTSQEWRTYEVPWAEATQVTIANLEPGQEYEFMVLVEDTYGNGVFSKSYRHFTKRIKTELLLFSVFFFLNFYLLK